MFLSIVNYYSHLDL